LPKHTVVASRVASAFLPVRAHLPFVPPRPPRLIFVGVTDRLLESTRSAKAIGRGCGGVDFWASTPVCGPPPRRTFGQRNASCHGLCLLQGCRALRRASAGLVPGYRSPASGTSTRRSSLTRDPSYPLMGFARRSFPPRVTLDAPEAAPPCRADPSRDCEGLSLRAKRRCPSAS